MIFPQAAFDRWHPKLFRVRDDLGVRGKDIGGTQDKRADR